MYVRTTSEQVPRALGSFGIRSDGYPIVSLNEYTYRKGTEIFGEKEPAEFVYQVKIGAVRSYKLLSDGRRQIGAFHLVGDIFGLTRDQHRFTAEAIVDTTLRLIRRSSLELFASKDPLVAGNLLNMTTKNLQHAEDHMLLLGRKNALEKVAAFLAEMDKRMIAGQSVSLPMTRRDIGDYLGLTIESVSRALSKLRAAGVLKFLDQTQREIVIIDRQLLARFDT